jgi:hypothetical protein
MSARLNLNQIGYFSWKGKTFSQITSSIQKNRASVTTNTNPTFYQNYFRPLPLKIYRREIATSGSYATNPVSHCNTRASLRIDELNRPNGYIVPTTANKGEGLVNTLDFNYPTSQYETNTGACYKTQACINQVKSALSRVRSSGNIKKKINGNDSYSVSSQQYLHNRNKSFEQNIYKASPRSTQTLINGFSSVPSRKACVVYKPNNMRFAQQGGVTASSLTNRVKYDAVTLAGYLTINSYGSAMANSVAYGVPYIGGVNPKTKRGFSMTCTPIIKKDGSVESCQYRVVNR